MMHPPYFKTPSEQYHDSFQQNFNQGAEQLLEIDAINSRQTEF